MTPLALTPPALEPVSLAQVKTFLRLDTTEEDELVTTLITAARLMIEAASGRMLVDQTWRIVIDRWPADHEIRLPLSPVNAIAAARVFDALGTPRTVPPSALMLDRQSDPARILIVGEVPEIGRARGAIEIDVVAGYGATAEAVPALLRQAIMRLVARWFEERGDVVGRDAAALPVAIAALVAPYRLRRL